MEFAVTVIGLVAVFCIALWVIHKQTLHARDMQSMFLQRQQFNFETQWKLWIKDREATDHTITNLAAWNAKLCETHVLMGQQLQTLAGDIEKRVAFAISQQMALAVKEVLSTVRKKETSS